MAGEKHEGKHGENDIEGRYLTFTSNEQLFGVAIDKVKEIVGMNNLKFVALPEMPSYGKGVITLRNRVIPVLSLCLRLDLPEDEVSERTCIVVIEYEQRGEMVHFGLLVDAVVEVQNIETEHIETSPVTNSAVDSSFIQGVAKVGDKINLLLDMEQVFRNEPVVG